MGCRAIGNTLVQGAYLTQAEYPYLRNAVQFLRDTERILWRLPRRATHSSHQTRVNSKHRLCPRGVTLRRAQGANTNNR